MLQLYTNTGMAKVMYEGDMPGLGVCWYYEDGIANVVSQAKAVRENGFEIDYSTRKDKDRLRDLTFCVETKEGVNLSSCRIRRVYMFSIARVTLVLEKMVVYLENRLYCQSASLL